MIQKLIGGLTLFAGIFIGLSMINPQTADASVGYVELRPTTTEDYRCYASSLLLPNNRFDVAINCVDLIFPPTNPPQVTSYVVWATPTNGRNPVRLGDLGKGLVRFETATAFNGLFVTVEPNANVRNPSPDTVMRGSLESFELLRRPSSPTPTLEPEDVEAEGNGEETEEENSTANLSTREKLLLALRRAGIAALIALIAIVGLIFVVTRSRG